MLGYCCLYFCSLPLLPSFSCAITYLNIFSSITITIALIIFEVWHLWQLAKWFTTRVLSLLFSYYILLSRALCTHSLICFLLLGQFTNCCDFRLGFSWNWRCFRPIRLHCFIHFTYYCWLVWCTLIIGIIEKYTLFEIIIHKSLGYCLFVFVICLLLLLLQ